MTAPSITFTMTLGDNADGDVGAIPVGFDQRALFGKARPPIVVTINGYTYRSTIAIMDGRSFVPLRASHRAAAGISAGDTIAVTLTLDTAPRVVEVPDDLAVALDQAERRAQWDALSFTARREQVEAIESARKPETRARRIAAAVSAVR